MQIPCWKDGKAYMFLFMLSVILLFVSDLSIFSYGYLSTKLMFISSVLLIAFFTYAIAFIAYGGAYRRYILLASFAAMVVAIAASYAVLYSLGYNFLSIGSLFVDYPIIFFIIILLMLFVSLGRYLGTIRSPRRTKLIAALAIIIILSALMWYFYFSGRLINSSIPDDEEFLALHAVQSLVAGHNPYAMNVSGLELYEYLHVNNSVGLPTLTTYNTVVGLMDYPDLYFLSLAPFYLLAKPSVYSYSHVYMLYSYAIFMLIFLVALVYAIEKDYIKRPNYWIIVFAAMFMLYISSVVDFLMFAALLAAYKYIDSKYAFVLLGIAASFQEELWIPVALLIALKFNKGISSGIGTAVGTAGSFLIINAYFVLQNPGLYIKDVFAPISGFLFPSPYGVFGYTLLTAYPMQLGAFSVLFYSAIIAAAIVIAYTGRKALVGVLSLLPLMFLYHSIPTYYFFFGVFAVAGLYIGKTEAPRAASRMRLTGGKHALKLAAISALAIIVLFDTAYVYTQHAEYVRMNPFDSVSGTLVRSGNYTIYNISLYYDSGSSANYSIFAYTFSRGIRMIPNTYGLLNQSVLKYGGYTKNDSSLSGMVNPNVAVFDGEGESKLVLAMNNPLITRAICNIYSGGFYYICPATTNNN